MKTANVTELEGRCLSAFKNEIGKALGPKVLEYRLFGSRARGQGDEESDLDLLVLTTESNVQIKNTIWDVANDIFLEHWVRISPLVMTSEEYQNLLARERLLALDIEKEGIRL